jgi:hypothetical protein
MDTKCIIVIIVVLCGILPAFLLISMTILAKRADDQKAQFREWRNK